MEHKHKINKIWTFKESESVETDGVDLKQFKPTGKFYDDVETACRLFGMRVHPALKPVTYAPLPGEEQPPHEEDKTKELNTINFYKHRVDRNTLKVLFLCLPACPSIHTLK